MSYNQVELVKSTDSTSGANLECRNEETILQSADTNGDKESGKEIALQSPVSALSIKYGISVRDYSLIPYVILTGLSIFVSVVSVEISPMVPHVDNEFFERDPSLAYQRFETVPSSLNAVVSIVIPALIIFGVTFITHIKFLGWTRFKLIFFIKSALPVICVMVSSATLARVPTRLLKWFVGSKRPTFFYQCNYKGYKEAVETGNFTSFLKRTDPMAFGDIKYCQASFAVIREGMESFTSGHASTSFAGIVCFCLWIYFYFSWFMTLRADGQTRTCRRNSILRVLVWQWKFLLRAVLTCAPLLVAIFVAASRVWDNAHRPLDIGFGSVIGIFVALLLFKSWIMDRDINVYYPTDPEAKTELIEHTEVPGSYPSPFLLGFPFDDTQVPRYRGLMG